MGHGRAAGQRSCRPRRGRGGAQPVFPRVDRWGRRADRCGRHPARLDRGAPSSAPTGGVDSGARVIAVDGDHGVCVDDPDVFVPALELAPSIVTALMPRALDLRHLTTPPPDPQVAASGESGGLLDETLRRGRPRRRSEGRVGGSCVRSGRRRSMAADRRAMRSRTGALTEATPGSRSSTLSTQPSGDARLTTQEPPGGADIERERGAHRRRWCAARGARRATRCRRDGRRRGRRAARSLPSRRASAPAPGGDSCASGAPSSAARPSVDQPNPSANRPSPSRRTKPVGLQRDRQPVRGGPGQAGGGDELAQRLGPSARRPGRSTALSSTPTPLTIGSTARD